MRRTPSDPRRDTANGRMSTSLDAADTLNRQVRRPRRGRDPTEVQDECRMTS
jgi:hypothetical protein